MSKKDWKTLTTSQLLEEVEKDSNEEFWGEIFDALISRSPFEGMYEKMEELENLIIGLEKENKELKNIIRNHAHLDGDVVIKA